MANIRTCLNITSYIYASHLVVTKRTSVLEIKISLILKFVSRFAKLGSVGLLIRLRDEHYNRRCV